MRNTATAVGLAWSPKVSEIVTNDPHVADFVEVPFERLRVQPNTLSGLDNHLLILHCSSMSIGGDVPPSAETIESIRNFARVTKTPWIGEHLAFTAAHRFDDHGNEILDTEFTICPQFSEPMLEIATRNYIELSSRFEQELILENPPQYFFVPGSTMSQMTFIKRLCDRADARLLLDLSHLYITARNIGETPNALLEQYPVENVVEIHISGVSEERGLRWDNHAVFASDDIFELLRCCLKRVRPKAVTLEYNWHSQFEDDVMMQHIKRIRDAV